MNALKRYAVFFPATLLVIIFCAPYPSIKTSEHSAICSAFGNSPFPIWSHLTGSEIAALKNADSARAGNPDALLALAIFASGNVRDSETYYRYINQVKSFVDSVRPGIDSLKSAKEKARLLYAKLCRTFYDINTADDELSGYTLNQSQLTETLRTRKFNCVSSVLLCCAIFRYFNFNVQGLKLPSHVFLQMVTADSGIVEIETTNKTGFDFKHDAEFFKRESSGWSKSRGLEPITPETYRHRQVLTPFEVVCYNMINQHTDSLRMAPCDRNRLYESAGFLLPENAIIQSNRISVLVDFFNRYNETKDTGNTLKLFDKVGPIIPPLLETYKRDSAMLDILSVLDMQYAVSLAKSGRVAEARRKADAVIARTDTTFKSSGLFINNACFVYARGVDSLLHHKNYPEIRQLLNTIPWRLSGTKQMNEISAYAFLTAGNALAADKNYRDALAHYFTAIPFCDTLSIKAAWNNIQASYLNLALLYSNKNDKAAAKQVLDECIDKSPDCSKCKDRRETMH